MTTHVWIGNASKTAQVDLLTVGGTIETDDVFIVTINGKDLSVVGGSATASTVATNIATAFNASTEPEFEEITADASAADGTLTLTSDTAGRPFTVTVSTTEDGGGTADSQTFQRAASVANKGPNVINDADNWSNGAVPSAADDLVFSNSSISCLYELDHFNGDDLNVTIDKSYTGLIGLPEENRTSSAKPYNEYRPTYFELGDGTLTVGYGAGSGSGRMKLDYGTAQVTGTVYATGQRSGSEGPALMVKSTHASSSMEVLDGDVGVAALGGESSTMAVTQRGGVVYVGAGTTLDNVSKTGGTLMIAGAATQASKTLTIT